MQQILVNPDALPTFDSDPPPLRPLHDPTLSFLHSELLPPILKPKQWLTVLSTKCLQYKFQNPR